MDSTAPLMPPGLEGTADKKEKADKQLQALLSKRGNVDSPEVNFWVKQIRSSLETFETQLNSYSGHFILELLQNADDNTYDASVIPTFEMKLLSSPDGHTFHTSCNESGFSIEQIDSLCEIGDSTKKHQKNIDGGYIGEKGLGFKSVFSVADVVYVSSGFYSFKLDKTQPMGEFMPTPSPFPAPECSDENHSSTRMMLQIRKDHAVLEKTLQTMTPEILLFLRRLRRIQIDAGAYKSVFIATRHDYDDEFIGETRTVKTWKDPGQAETTTKYVISRDIVENMPEENKRPGVTVSEVALGFPLGCDNKADARPQYAFSFIPFQKPGFHFLIQADFILVASRESLNLDNRWNQKLRRAIPDTFEKAVHRFINAESELRYTWPEYLGHDTLVDEFWKELETLIVKHLGNLAILQSRAAGDDCFQKPGDLVFIPPEYRLHGKALIDCPDQRRRQLAFEYTTDNTLSPGLKRLGVQKMGLHDFIDTFCEWIAKQEPTFLDTMTKEWHNKIADLLLQGGFSFKAMLQKIPIVPTITGEWVSATEQGLCCASEKFVHGVPSSLGLRIVASSARLESKREELFRFLGIKELSEADICNQIVDLHREEDRRPRAQLVEETSYLFLHRNAIRAPKFRHLRLWFATRNEPACKRGYSAYVIDPEIEPNVVEKLHSNNEAYMHVIHQEHLDQASRAMEAKETEENAAGSTKDDLKGRRRAARDIFFDWLEDYCGVAKLPRLVIQNRLSLEGRFLLQKKPCLLLQLLRDRWSVYEKDRTVLEKSLRRLAMLCTDGMWRNLEDTAVPTMILKKACPRLSFASLPEPENRNWAMLSNFSVVTDPGITAHVRELKDLRAKERKSIDLEDARRIYQHLAGNDADEVRRSIELEFCAGDNRVVFHPTRGWVSSDECVWKSACAFDTTAEISKLYPALDDFFCEVLGIKNAGVVEVVKELERLSVLPSHAQASNLLKKTVVILNNYIASETPESSDDLRQRLRSLQIFPVIAAGQPAGMKQATPRSLTDVWYIADQPTLRKEFLGHVDILDFDVSEVEELGPLIKWLQLEELLLSKAVTERKVAVGTSVHRQDWSRSLERRAVFMSLLGECRGSENVESLPKLRVFEVLSVQVWKNAGSKEIITGSGDISIEKKDGFVDIFLRYDPNETHTQVDDELVGFFVQLCSVTKIEFFTLVPLILKASDNDIRALLEKRGIRCPCTVGSETDDGDANIITDEPVSTSAARDDGPAHMVITPAPSQRRDSSDNDRFTDVGLLGETLVEGYFKKRIPDWDANQHWTSKLREKKGHRCFTEDESKFSDFTYTDEHDYMLKVLKKRGIGRKEWAGQGITYHIEVKATVFGRDEAFSLSQNQTNMMLKYALNDVEAPKDVFILVRAYHVQRSDRRFKFYMNPWLMIANGDLVMKGPFRIAPGI